VQAGAGGLLKHFYTLKPLQTTIDHHLKKKISSDNLRFMTNDYFTTIQDMKKIISQVKKLTSKSKYLIPCRHKKNKNAVVYFLPAVYFFKLTFFFNFI